jgi:hypothetical protein
VPSAGCARCRSDLTGATSFLRWRDARGGRGSCGRTLASDDEALRRSADELKRIARDERQRWPIGPAHHGQVVGFHDEGVGDRVLERAADRRQPDEVALADPLQRTKVRVAVRGDHAVAAFPWQRAVWKMPSRDAEGAVVIPERHDDRQFQPRHFQAADDITRADGNLRSALVRTRQLFVETGAFRALKPDAAADDRHHDDQQDDAHDPERRLDDVDGVLAQAR